MATEDEELLEAAKEQFSQSVDAFEANQTRYEKDVKFGRMGEQWNADDIEARKNQGRPSLTVNRMPSFIRQVVNDARQNKPSIKVHPFDDKADPETAEVINGIIRNIEQVSKADLAYDTAIDCATSGGFGYFRVDLDYADDDTFDMDIRINRILNPLTIYTQLESEYAAAGIELLNTRDTTSHKVTQYIMNGQQVLETNEWPGKFIPIVPLYGEEVFIDGERHFFSLIHFAKDAQSIYNYWRTTTTELVAMAPKTPWIGPSGSFDTDLDRWQNANTETYSYLEYDGDVPPQRQPFAGPPAGALQEALNASDDMKSVMGLHDASMGAQSNEISGVAIGKRVRESDTSTYHFIDNMARAIRHAGIIIVDLMPMIYSKPRMMRILGEDGVPQTVAVNQQLTKEQEMLQGEMMEQREAMDAIYDLTVGKYDVTVKAGPSYTTQREEARESMIALLPAFPQAASVTGDLVVNAMDWPNADIFAKRLKSLLPPGVIDEQDDPRLAQMGQQMQGMEQVINQLMADREGKQAAIQVDREKLVIDSRKVDIDYMQAETKRMEAEIKNKEADIKAAEAMREDSPNNTPIMVKQMDNAMKEVALTQEAQIATDKLDIEREKLEIERDKLNLEKYKADMDATVKMTGKTDVDVTVNEIEVSPAE